MCTHAYAVSTLESKYNFIKFKNKFTNHLKILAISIDKIEISCTFNCYKQFVNCSKVWTQIIKSFFFFNFRFSMALLINTSKVDF